MAGYVIEFAAENPHACVMRQYIRDLLTEQGCEVEMHDDGESKREFLYIRASDEVLKEERRRVMDRQGRVASINDAEVELTALTRERMLHSIIDRIYASEEDMNPLMESKHRYPLLLPPLAELHIYQNDPVVSKSIHHEDSVIKAVFPLHDRDVTGENWGRIFTTLGFMPCVEDMRVYFGERAAFYFAWLNFYIIWLVGPAVFGSVCFFMSDSADSMYVSLYSLFLCFWSTLFLCFWLRHSNSLAWKWGVFHHEAVESVRPEFEGEMQQSEITGEFEKTYPSFKRRMKYLVTIPVVLGMLVVSLVGMAACLNISGYMDPTSMFYVWFLNYRGEDGRGLVKADDPVVLTLVPSVLHAVVIIVLNQVYVLIARALNDWENYRTDADYERAYIIKVVPFQLFNCFLSLFYLAFYEGDMEKVHVELMGLFLTDQFRRVAVEAVLPFVVERWRDWRGYGAAANRDNILKVMLHEADMDPVEDFNDWIEMVIQFGYVVLFAAAYPLSGLLAMVSNLVEIRSDALKYYLFSRRSPARKSRDIGVWYDVLNLLAYGAVITNCAIFGFVMAGVGASGGDDSDLSVGGGAENTSDSSVAAAPPAAAAASASESTTNVFAVIIVLEHVLLLLKLVMQHGIPNLPEWLFIEIKKEKYQAQLKVKEAVIAENAALEEADKKVAMAAERARAKKAKEDAAAAKAMAESEAAYGDGGPSGLRNRGAGGDSDDDSWSDDDDDDNNNNNGGKAKAH